jgi:ferredoxin
LDRPLGYRILRYGLKMATRAANDMVERIVQRDPSGEPAPTIPSRRPWQRRDPNAPVEVEFEGHGRGAVENGTTVLEAADLLGVDLSHYCGGNCSCGTCKVLVLAGARNLSRRESMESMVLGPGLADQGWRLACQTRILGPATLRVPEFL